MVFNGRSRTIKLRYDGYVGMYLANLDTGGGDGIEGDLPGGREHQSKPQADLDLAEKRPDRIRRTGGRIHAALACGQSNSKHLRTALLVGRVANRSPPRSVGYGLRPDPPYEAVRRAS